MITTHAHEPTTHPETGLLVCATCRADMEPLDDIRALILAAFRELDEDDAVPFALADVEHLADIVEVVAMDRSLSTTLVPTVVDHGEALRWGYCVACLGRRRAVNRRGQEALCPVCLGSGRFPPP